MLVTGTKELNGLYSRNSKWVVRFATNRLAHARYQSSFVARQEFPNYTVTLAQFHGHHKAALQKLHDLGRMTDFVVELRDSRAPITTMNPLLREILGHLPRLVVYTNADRSSFNKEILATWPQLEESFCIDATRPNDVRLVLQRLKSLVEGGPDDPSPPLGYRLLVTGMPNVGKSTFLNTIRKVGLAGSSSNGRELKNVAKPGNQPGVTKKVASLARISESPDILVHDTPGVMVPQVTNSEAMLKLCLVHAVKPSNVVSWEVLADYLLFHINKAYPDEHPYPGPHTNNIDELLERLHESRNAKSHKKGELNPNAISEWWVQRYIRGDLGKRGLKLLFDDVSPDAYEQAFRQRMQSGNLWDRQSKNPRQMKNLLL